MTFGLATYRNNCLPNDTGTDHLHRIKTAHPGSLSDSDIGARRYYLKVFPPSNLMKCQNSRAVWIEQPRTIFVRKLFGKTNCSSIFNFAVSFWEIHALCVCLYGAWNPTLQTFSYKTSLFSFPAEATLCKYWLSEVHAVLLTCSFLYFNFPLPCHFQNTLPICSEFSKIRSL